MKKTLLAFILILSTVKLFGQQFSQYNTGTLYDSFENPSQKAFVTDTSRKYASNFLIPNFNANFFLTGDAQSSLKSRAFYNKYDNSSLLIGQGRYNHANINANAYLVMFKMFSSLNGDTELGFSFQTKMEGKTAVTDESVALFDGVNAFPNNLYTNLFNDNFYFQSYHQMSFTYKEKINKEFTFGIKLSALLGIQYEELRTTSSQLAFDKANSSAILALSGVYYSNYIPGHLSPRDYLPTFRNPGASISLGASYRTPDGFIIQGNIKDLGFIHWSGRSNIYAFNTTETIEGLGNGNREAQVYNALSKIIHDGNVGGQTGSFSTNIDGLAELSINKKYWIDDDHNFRYSPTLIASKELFYPGFTGALVNSFQYKKYSLALTPTYDDMKLFNLGLQLMVQSQNFEFYLGSDKLAQSVSLASAQMNRNSGSTFQNGNFTGADFFLGFSIKFGPTIEHPLNASVIPMGEKGFLGRLWGRIFKTND